MSKYGTDGLTTEIHFLTIAQASALIAAKKLSPVEYVRALIDRAAALDDQVCAYITRSAERALAAARVAEADIVAGRYRGRLHGIPYGLKDIYDAAGMPTTGHSKICIENMATGNAATVEKLELAGAVLMGKLATHEFASGGPSLDLPWPPARNPWSTAHFTGSSSSGSGAAVAAGFVPFALGSDTGGSIRIPAALCGVAGLKPTYGRVSRRGIIPNSFTFDHAGPLAWTAEDCAIVLQAIAGHDPGDHTSSREPVPDYVAALTGDIRGLRVGVVRHFWEEEGKTHPEMAAAMEAAIDVLKGLGARVEIARMRTREAYNDVKMVIAKSELVAIHEQDMRERLADFGADFVGRNLPGFLFTALDYVRAQRERKAMLDEMKPLYERFDVLVTASSTPAVTLQSLLGAGFSQKWEQPNIYTPFSTTGSPCLVVCNGYTKEGLPLAMQIAGRPFDEATVLCVGDTYEKATQWRRRRPALTPGNAPAPLEAPPVESLAEGKVDPAIRNVVEAAIARAGLALSPHHRALLYRVAPPVIAAVNRIRRDRPRADEQAGSFNFW